MANTRELVKRRKAVRNIRKITRTMELIATARFKKAMDRATQAAAYTRKMSEIVADLSEALAGAVADAAASGLTHPLLQKHAEEKNAVLLSYSRSARSTRSTRTSTTSPRSSRSMPWPSASSTATSPARSTGWTSPT